MEASFNELLCDGYLGQNSFLPLAILKSCVHWISIIFFLKYGSVASFMTVLCRQKRRSRARENRAVGEVPADSFTPCSFMLVAVFTLTWIL